MFVNIGREFYIPAEDIKFVFSSKLSSGNNRGPLFQIVNKAKLQNSFMKNFADSSQSFIVLLDNIVIATPFSVMQLTEALISSGLQLLTMRETLAFVNIAQIKMIQNSNVSLTVTSKKVLNISDVDISFCRQRETKATRLIMKTGEIVHLSRRTDEVITEINKTICESK